MFSQGQIVVSCLAMKMFIDFNIQLVLLHGSGVHRDEADWLNLLLLKEWYIAAGQTHSHGALTQLGCLNLQLKNTL